METPEAEGFSARDYLGVLWRRWWLILLVVVVATGSAWYVSYRQTSQYRASTDMLFVRQLDVADPLSGSSSVDTTGLILEADNMGTIVTGPDVKQRALSFAPALSSADYKVSAKPKTGGSQNTITVGAIITAEGPRASVAALAANTYAQAVIDLEKDQEKARIQQAVGVIQQKLLSYDTAALKQSPDYILLQQRLRDLQILYATVSGDFRVVAPAKAPTAPFTPRPLRSALLGLGVGLFGGIGLALLLHQFDNSLQSRDQVSEMLHLPLLGQIPKLKKTESGEGHVVTLEEPESHGAEAFRMVRGNLDFLTVDGGYSTLMVTSCVKGEGKTLTVCNLAVTLALAGKRVVLVDCDLRRPRVHAVFGVANDTGVSTVVSGQSKLVGSLKPVFVARGAAWGSDGDVPYGGTTAGDGSRLRMYVLPSGPKPPNPGEICTSPALGALLKDLSRQADVVLVDSPAMLAVGDTAALANKVDGLLFLVDMHVVKRSVLREAVDKLAQMPCRKLGVVVTRQPHGAGYYSQPYYYSYDDSGAKVRKRAKQGAGKLGSAGKQVGRR